METSPSDADPRYGLLDPAALATIAGLEFLRGLVDGSMPAPPEHGPVTCVAVLLHRGGQIASAEGKILDREGRLVAHGSKTCFIRALGAGSGR